MQRRLNNKVAMTARLSAVPPCPWCAGRDFHIDDCDGESFFVKCGICGAWGPWIQSGERKACWAWSCRTEKRKKWLSAEVRGEEGSSQRGNPRLGREAPSCPFCGYKRFTRFGDKSGNDSCMIVCMECSAKGPDASMPEEALTRWSMRITRLD